MLSKREPKKYPKEEISADGYDYGVNVRKVVTKYVNNIKVRHYDNPDMDETLLVVWHGGINKYVIVNGQHLFVSRSKPEWSCVVIEGDINNNQELVDECLDHSTQGKMSNHSMQVSHQCVMCMNLHERFLRQTHSRTGVTEYIQSKTGLSYDVVRSRITLYRKLQDNGILEECIAEDLTNKEIKNRLSSNYKTTPEETEYEDGICQRNIEEDKLYQERQKPATGEVCLNEISEDSARSHITIGQEKVLKEHIHILNDEIKSLQIKNEELSQEHSIFKESYTDLNSKYSELKYEFDTFIKRNKE